MTTKALMEKAKRTPKYSVRKQTRCFNCGRARSVFRKFLLCRLCFRLFVYRGWIPGFRKV